MSELWCQLLAIRQAINGTGNGTFTPSLALETTGGTVAAGFKSVTFLAPVSNTTNATVDGVAILPGVSLTFSGNGTTTSDTALAYVASATAQLYVLTVT